MESNTTVANKSIYTVSAGTTIMTRIALTLVYICRINSHIRLHYDVSCSSSYIYLARKRQLGRYLTILCNLDLNKCKWMAQYWDKKKLQKCTWQFMHFRSNNTSVGLIVSFAKINLLSSVARFFESISLRHPCVIVHFHRDLGKAWLGMEPGNVTQLSLQNSLGCVSNKLGLCYLLPVQFFPSPVNPALQEQM